MGINPAVTHMNEGHSAFLGIERIREYMHNDGMTRQEAMAGDLADEHLHHPHPRAGRERALRVDLMQKYFPVITDGTGFTWDEFIALGREESGRHDGAVLHDRSRARLSAYNNGVSELHGDVSREMWKQIWPELPVEEVPITHVTNGVHSRSFLSPEIKDLLDRYFGPRFYDEPTNLEIWERMVPHL
jgi:starch phosphorylase